MKITNRPTLVGALVGALALGATIDVATAQYTQDTSGVSQSGQNRTSPSTQTQDTSMAGQTGQTGSVNPAGQDTSSVGQTGASADSTRTPKLPQQGGAADTAGYTKFKSEMGPAKDTLNAAGKTTNYQQQKQYRAKPSVVDTTPGAASQTSEMGTQDTSMRSQTGATSDTGMKKSKSKHHKKTGASDTGAVGQQQHKGGMSHDSTRATPDTSH
ncbi:MAG TPA: hypothetical protein VFS33_03390 [Gemmatimonadales bacterium]|nr:hypothetical protein [Gemmatimonadales bacterium]